MEDVEDSPIGSVVEKPIEAKPEPEKAPEPKPAPEKVEADKKPAPVKADAPAERPIKARLPKRPPLPTTAEQAPAAPQPVAPAAKPDDKGWENDLLDEEREMLADARYAEKKFPQKHGGLAAKTERFIKEHSKLLEQGVNENDPAKYQQFLKTNPRLQGSAMREIIVAQSRDETKKDFEPELDKIKHELYVRDEEPKIKAEGQRILTELTQTALPEDLQQAYREAGGGKAGLEVLQKEYAAEFDIANQVISTATRDLEEFARLSRVSASGKPLSVQAQDPSDPRWEQHQRLQRMVTELCSDFKETGGQALQKRNPQTGETQWFVTREEWNALPPANRRQFWTFSNEELSKRGQQHVKLALAASVKSHRDEMTRLGYQRVPRAVKPAPKQAPVVPAEAAPHPAPRGTASPAPQDTQGSKASAYGSLASLLKQAD